MLFGPHIGKIRPVDSMMYAIEMLFWPGIHGDNFRRGIRADWERYGRPGAVIDMMKRRCPEWAEPLKDLKSEDFDKMWFDFYYDDQVWQGKKRMSEMLMEFDKKILKR